MTNENKPDDFLADDFESIPMQNEELSETAQLQAQIDALMLEKDQLEDRMIRTLAEVENVRKRKQKELDEVIKYQSLSLAKSMLPVLSNLRRAITAAQKDATVESLKTGIEMVAKQLDDVLTQNGVNKIITEGQLFDPNLHDVLQMVPSDQPEHMIVKELDTGYKLHDRVIVPSKVVVSTGTSAAE